MESLLKIIQQAFENNTDEFSQSGWQLQRIYGGMNAIIYRATNLEKHDSDYAVKIRKRDARRRAWREFAALTALKQHNIPIAPNPVALYEGIESLPGDVVISTWIQGNKLDDLTHLPRPVWQQILETLIQCHALKPADAPELIPAFLPICSSQMLIQEIERRHALLPDGQMGETTKQAMGKLIDAFKNEPRFWIDPIETSHFVMCDVNPANMVVHDDKMIWVDWENSGWGDAAFDVADMLVRPNCAGVTEAERKWIYAFYAEQSQNDALAQRIKTYEQIFLVFWLVITSNGFVMKPGERLPGITMLPEERTRQQQLYYLQRIEDVLGS